jgi:hypothetical protein
MTLFSHTGTKHDRIKVERSTMTNDRSNPTDGTAQQEEEKEAQNNQEREAPPSPLLDQGFCKETLVVEEEGEETNDPDSQSSEAAFVNKGTFIYSMRLLLDTRCFFPLMFSLYYHIKAFKNGKRLEQPGWHRIQTIQIMAPLHYKSMVLLM